MGCAIAGEYGKEGRLLSILVDVPDELLEPALEASRLALRRLDEDHVPARLRDVAGRSGRLPKPLARRLLRELDGSEWLRSEALDAWPGADVADPQHDRRISSLFLLRPPGWEEEVARTLGERSLQGALREAETLRRETERARRRIAELEEALERTRAEGAAAVDRAVADQRDSLARAKRESSERRSEVAALRRQLEKKELALARGSALEAELRARIEELQAGMERRRARMTRAGKERAWPPRSPLELAGILDELQAMLAVGEPAVVEVETASSGERLLLPVSVRPDGVEAIDWLLRLGRPITLVIDGWNVAFLLAGNQEPDHRHREQVELSARRLRGFAASPLTLQLIFDSKQGEDQAPGKDVRFVPSADDEIIKLARQRQGAMVVVTSDRRVREEAEAAGAVGLWSQALVEWMVRR
jgi:hypothetical protein